MIYRSITVLSFIFFCVTAKAQQPKYSFKHFVSYDDPKEFVSIVPKKDGFNRAYVMASPQIWDVDDDNTTFIKGGQKALLCFEGSYKNGQRDGVYSVYLLDSADHNKRYKIWEQRYAADHLNGEWRTYTLKGTLVSYQTYKNDSLQGTEKNYWIDGKTVIEENIYLTGKTNYIHKEYSESGKIVLELTIVNGASTGPAKRYYPDGTIQEEAVLLNGIPNGIRKYYYPSGKLWIEEELKNGLSWTAIANYTEDGKKRNAGNLKEGNGSIIFYNDDGSIRETITYKNGIALK